MGHVVTLSNPENFQICVSNPFQGALKPFNALVCFNLFASFLCNFMPRSGCSALHGVNPN